MMYSCGLVAFGVLVPTLVRSFGGFRVLLKVLLVLLVELVELVLLVELVELV